MILKKSIFEYTPEELSKRASDLHKSILDNLSELKELGNQAERNQAVEEKIEDFPDLERVLKERKYPEKIRPFQSSRPRPWPRASRG